MTLLQRKDQLVTSRQLKDLPVGLNFISYLHFNLIRLMLLNQDLQYVEEGASAVH